MANRDFLELSMGMTTASDPAVSNFYAKLFESHGGNVSGDLASIFKSKESAQSFLESVNEVLAESTYEGQGLANSILREDAAARAVSMQNVVNEMLTEATQQGLSALKPISLTSFGFQIRSYVKAVMHRAVKTIQAERPSFKITERKQYVIDIAGNKHYFTDAFNRNSDLVNNLHQKFDFTVTAPTTAYDIFTSGSIDKRNKLGIDVVLKSFTGVKTDGTTAEVAGDLKIVGRNRQIDIETGRFSVDVTIGPELTKATIMGEIDFEAAVLTSISATSSRVKTVTFGARLSSETHLKALQTGFEHKHTNVAIPDGAHIEVNPSVEFLDDVTRMTGINVLEEYTNQMGQLVEQLEDRTIYEALKDLESQAILAKTFNVTPDASFSLGREEWLRREFHPFIERICIRLKAELQLDDCHFRVVGNPIDIRVPNASGEQYIFRRNQDMTGASQINYDFAVMSTGNTVFYLSTDRVAPGKIYVNLIPNSIQNNIITVNHYRYANYVSNKYRSSVNPALPAIMVSSRYQTKEYNPVMAVITMDNNYSDFYTGRYA
jgi:hypothetical protein